jgi:putative membrane protein
MMGFGGSGMIAMVVFWFVVVGLAVWLLSYLFPRRINNSHAAGDEADSSSPESALDILKRRYARGEISRDEYEAVRRDLVDK